MLAHLSCPTSPGATLPALARGIAAFLLGLALQAQARLVEPVEFAIDARMLSPALIQFSQQSGVAIAFSDKLTRNLPAPRIVGSLTGADALDLLLENSQLGWQLVNDRIVAIYDRSCEAQYSPGRECATPRETLSRYPVYTPGIEETFIYGTRLTGSRIRRIGFEGVAPVDVLSAPDIELSGAQTLGDLLKFHPAVAGNATSTAISNGGDGTASVTLRGLPASNTLVLINGRRVANDGLAGESVDLNSIPPAAVERIEILKDGASAIYGSDAIAGVVNVIMKRDFYGLLAETYYGEAGQGDLETRTHTLQYGGGMRNGSYLLSATLYQQDPIFSRDRRVSDNADTRSRGGTDQRSSATPDARVTLPDGRSLIADADDYRPATDEDLFNYQRFTSAVASLERNSVYGNLSYDFSESVTSLFELGYVETESTATLAPTPVFTGFEQTPLPIAADNRFNPFGVQIDDARRRLIEFPERTQRNQSETTRFSAAVEGLYADWNWELAYNWSRSEAQEITRNLVNAANLQAGLGPASDCRGAAVDGCVPVNLLGSAGSIDPLQADFLRADGEVHGYFKLWGVSAYLGRTLLELPYGRGDIAFGLEHREEATSKRPRGLLATTPTLGGTNFEPTSGDRSITEMYTETILPAWKSPTGFFELDVEAAARYSNYSDFGESITPRFGIRLRTGPAILLRASYAEGFRAPSLNELYEGSTEEQAFISDPCQSADNVGSLPGCTRLADPTRNQFLTLKGGNPDLDAETSRTVGIGLVLSPEQFPGLLISADLFDVEQQDVVAASAQFIVDQNAINGRFENRVERDEAGNLLQVRANNLNVGNRDLRGMDFALDYHRDTRWGKFMVSGSATWMAEYRARLDATSGSVEVAGTFRDEASEGLGGIPSWKAQLGLRWNRNRWQGNYALHFVDEMEEQLPGSDRLRTIDAWLVHDLQLSYRFPVLEGLRWTLGLDNVFDESAPLAASAFNDNIDGRTHELKGRFWYTKLSQRF